MYFRQRYTFLSCVKGRWKSAIPKGRSVKIFAKVLGTYCCASKAKWNHNGTVNKPYKAWRERISCFWQTTNVCQLQGRSMKASQEEMKEERKSSQEKLKQDINNSQGDVKRGQEEMKQKLEDKVQEMKTTIEDSNTKLENKLKEFEEVGEEINQVKDEKIEDLETKVRQLSTTGIIKTEGSVAATKIKVPTYDRKVSWNTYLRQSEAVVCNWREEEKATSLIAALRSDALEVVRTIPESSQDYKAITSALEKRYGDAHLQHVYQAQLRNRKQRFEETLKQYEADVSGMVNLAYPTAPAEVIEQLSVSSFVDGLRDPEISQLVRLARHKTISEALAQALEMLLRRHLDL
ncbi:hypothetical protein NQ315_014065 [Exocentrus adspersus]|uniref:Uncharacterized protein n=1 Tax=Exocentrus adspersus TaxID=1586481 RepID=A0AAV8VVD8_9CUCU|nr:hypothetical protein NQ315_014065 [Exocentrus adspersus]